MGGQSPMSQGGDLGAAGGEECNDGGIVGGGIGGGMAGMGCGDGQSGAGSVGEFPGGGDADRAAELEGELDKSLGEFDEALGEEQRKVSSVGRNTEGFGGGGGRGGTISLGEQSAGAMAGSSGGGGGGGGGVANADQSERKGPLDGMSEQDIEMRTPDDIDLTAYDDIVARQLREAALAENDPELRDRLWEEYRKYKGMK